MTKTTLKMLFTTSNIGSLFIACPDEIQNNWMQEIIKVIRQYKPSFFALHMQEVGGKDSFKLSDVDGFLQKFYHILESAEYSRGRAFIDDDFESPSYTALGSAYFIHKDTSDVRIYNFASSSFVEVENFRIHRSKTSEFRSHVRKEWFSNALASRKGYLWTKWILHNKITNLVNVHLFHDACNLTSVEQSPSVYSDKRKDALLQTLLRIRKEDGLLNPLFIFGDFNFRLNIPRLINDLTKDTIKMSCDSPASNGMVNRKQFEFRKKSSDDVVLRLGSKLFEYKLADDGLTFRDYDWEIGQFSQLFEAPIDFPPSYPFSEDLNRPATYMRTRPPAYCDRVLMNDIAWDLAKVGLCDKTLLYDYMGKEACVGDHKPVYLVLDYPTEQCTTKKRN